MEIKTKIYSSVVCTCRLFKRSCVIDGDKSFKVTCQKKQNKTENYQNQIQLMSLQLDSTDIQQVNLTAVITC